MCNSHAKYDKQKFNTVEIKGSMTTLSHGKNYGNLMKEHKSDHIVGSPLTKLTYLVSSTRETTMNTLLWIDTNIYVAQVC